MSLELKIKAKSLAAEAQFIRKEEREQLGYSRYLRTTNNWPGFALNRYDSLRARRVGIVRETARATHLARAFIAGREYRTVEQPVHKPLPEADRTFIAQMATRYGGFTDTITKEHIYEWINLYNDKPTKPTKPTKGMKE